MSVRCAAMGMALATAVSAVSDRIDSGSMESGTAGKG